MKCGVDKNMLSSMIQLAEYGVKPEHIATIVTEIKHTSNNWRSVIIWYCDTFIIVNTILDIST